MYIKLYNNDHLCSFFKEKQAALESQIKEKYTEKNPNMNLKNLRNSLSYGYCNPHYRYFDIEEFICVDPFKVEVCYFKIGKPLIIYDRNGRLIVIGFFTEKTDCSCQKGHVLIFTKLIGSICWIENVLQIEVIPDDVKIITVFEK